MKKNHYGVKISLLVLIKDNHYLRLITSRVFLKTKLLKERVETIMNTNHARKWEVPLTTAPRKETKVAVKVRKQSWITKGEKILYSIIGVAMIIACAFVVSYSSSTYTLNKEVQSLESTVQAQQEANDLLSFEVEKLSLPERITKIAKDNGLKIQDAEVKHAQGFNN